MTKEDGPIVDQLYDNMPTLKSILVCLNSLRVVSNCRPIVSPVNGVEK